jgi:DNA-binding SARP family transcriptional activator
VDARQWQRDKARQLFQFLLAEWCPDLSVRDSSNGAATPERGRPAAGNRARTGSGRWLQRERIVDLLWPELDPDAAARDFKVALNALVKAIEPETGPSGSARSYYFLEREGSAYRLRPDADIWYDAAEFKAQAHQALHGQPDGDALAPLRTALALYAGDYLPDSLYDDWTADERERLRTLYLRTADRLATVLVERRRADEALEICQAILDVDACWEHAYQLMMTIHLQQGNRTQARRIYARCVDSLHSELAVPPSPATHALFLESAG